jgi:hypothetical protein
MYMGAIQAARRLVTVEPGTPPQEHLAAAVELLRALPWPASPAVDAGGAARPGRSHGSRAAR